MFARIKEILKYGFMYGCITHCTFEYLGDFVVCNGPSMEPTLYTNNILLTERISARFFKPNRGDIIIAKSPVDHTQYICKRIIGLPGDKIITNSLPTDEHFGIEVADDYVPVGHVWIEGDNSRNSSDSRYYGAIPQGLIKSRIICRLWPLDKMKFLL